MNGGRPHLDFSGLDEDDDGVGDPGGDGSGVISSELSMIKMLALYTEHVRRHVHIAQGVNKCETGDDLPFDPVSFSESETRRHPSFHNGKQEYADTCAYHRTHTTRYPSGKPH
jgi:hypothetical protein